MLLQIERSIWLNLARDVSPPNEGLLMFLALPFKAALKGELG